jgi:hypothetical protein
LSGITTSIPRNDIKIARDYAERVGMSQNAGKGFRLGHEDDMTKGITAAIYEAIGATGKTKAGAS